MTRKCAIFIDKECHEAYRCTHGQECAIVQQWRVAHNYEVPGESRAEYLKRQVAFEKGMRKRVEYAQTMRDREPGGPLDPAVCDNVGPPPHEPEPPNLPAAFARAELQRWKRRLVLAMAFIALAIVAVGCMVGMIVIPVLSKIDRQHCCGHEVTGDNHGSAKPIGAVRPAADSKQ